MLPLLWPGSKLQSPFSWIILPSCFQFFSLFTTWSDPFTGERVRSLLNLSCFFLRVKAKILKMDCRDCSSGPHLALCLIFLFSSTTTSATLEFLPSFNLNMLFSWPLYLTFVLFARNTFCLAICMVCSRILLSYPFIREM